KSSLPVYEIHGLWPDLATLLWQPKQAKQTVPRDKSPFAAAMWASAFRRGEARRSPPLGRYEIALLSVEVVHVGWTLMNLRVGFVEGAYSAVGGHDPKCIRGWMIAADIAVAIDLGQRSRRRVLQEGMSLADVLNAIPGPEVRTVIIEVPDRVLDG